MLLHRLLVSSITALKFLRWPVLLQACFSWPLRTLAVSSDECLMYKEFRSQSPPDQDIDVHPISSQQLPQEPHAGFHVSLAATVPLSSCSSLNLMFLTMLDLWLFSESLLPVLCGSRFFWNTGPHTWSRLAWFDSGKLISVLHEQHFPCSRIAFAFFLTTVCLA